MMEIKKRESRAEREVEAMTESGYQWPRPERRSVYLYPVQWKMIDEISRTWKKKKRDVFFEAIQQYIGFYVAWKNKPAGDARPK
jgi:hypothetical protein